MGQAGERRWVAQLALAVLVLGGCVSPGRAESSDARSAVEAAGRAENGSAESASAGSSPASTAPLEPPLPDSRARRWVGFVDRGGRHPAPGVSKRSSGAISFEPAFSVIRVDDHGHDLLWFERGLPAQAASVVIDAVDVPPSSDGERVFLVTLHCWLEGEVDPEVVAVLGPITGEQTPNGTPVTTAIAGAWRFNRSTERIEPIPTDGITCPEDRYEDE